MKTLFMPLFVAALTMGTCPMSFAWAEACGNSAGQPRTEAVQTSTCDQDQAPAAKADKKKDKKDKKKDNKRRPRVLMRDAQGNIMTEEQIAAKRERDAREKAYLDSLLNITYTDPGTFDYGPQPLVWKDEPATLAPDTLKPFFHTIGNTTLPGDVTMNRRDNAVFFCFDATGGKPDSLRLRIQYFADDPLGMNKLHFVIDGFDYYYKPVAVQAGKEGARLYWEQFDEPLKAADKDLVYALAHCTWANVTFESQSGMEHLKTFTPEQLTDFRRALQLYLGLGGTIN